VVFAPKEGAGGGTMGFPHPKSPRVDSNHDWSGSEPDASARLGYEGGEEPQVGIEPTAFRLQGGCSAELSFEGVSAVRDSNPQPPLCKRGALRN
jgi:hypothetical protein